MSAKGVYSNKGLQVYITAESFEFLLEHGQICYEVHIGKNTFSIGQGFIHLRPDTVRHLTLAITREQSAIDQARNEYSDAFAKRSQSIRKSNKE